MKLDPLDAAGDPISIGDTVLIVGVPDLGSMAPAQRAESLPVFEYLVGKHQQVDGFNQVGMVELYFSIESGPARGRHFVAIEPYLLRVRRNDAQKE